MLYMSQSPSRYNVWSVNGTLFSNVMVDVTISCRSFVFSQSRAKASAGFRQTCKETGQTGSSIQEQMLPCHLHR